MAKKGDFLTILIVDEMFKNRNERIIDEVLTFFFAGSQTSSVTVQNLVYALCKHPAYQDKILEELNREIVQPHLKETGRSATEDMDILSLITYENCNDLQFYGSCFNESLRIMAPVYYSSSICMSEDV